MSINFKKQKTDLKEFTNKNFFLIFGDKYREERIENLQSKLKIVDLICLICVKIGVLCAVIAAENNINFEFPIISNEENIYDLKDVIISYNSDSTIVTIFRSIVSFTTAIVILCIILHYLVLIKIKKYKLNLLYEDNIFSSGLYKYLILEIILNLIHIPPLIDGTIEITQRKSQVRAQMNIDYMMTITLLFTRSYQTLKFISFHSKFCSYQIEKICSKNNIPIDFLFSIKAEFKQNPFRLVVTIMLYSVFVFGYSVRSIEMFFMPGSDMDLDWRYWMNGVWCVILTMSTVGFGDYYPISILGRAIIIIASFWGTFLISLMVAALSLTVEFNSQEEMAYQSIKSANFELQFGKTATKLIQTALRYYWHVNAEDTNSYSFRMKKSHLLIRLKDVQITFRELKKSKIELMESQLIAYSLYKLDDNISIQMNQIKKQFDVLDIVKNMLLEYSQNQNIIKEKQKILLLHLEEIVAFKDSYLKEKDKEEFCTL